MSADATEFRAAMARLGAAVNLISTDGPGRRHGLIASSVCSVTDTPPTLLVCINRNARANAIIKANGVLCVNVLAERHRALSDAFATLPPEERFAAAQWRQMATGAPALVDATAALDCRVTAIHEVGTHSIFYAEIADIALHDSREGLVWFDRGYHPLGAPSALSAAASIG